MTEVYFLLLSTINLNYTVRVVRSFLKWAGEKKGDWNYVSLQFTHVHDTVDHTTEAKLDHGVYIYIPTFKLRLRSVFTALVKQVGGSIKRQSVVTHYKANDKGKLRYTHSPYTNRGIDHDIRVKISRRPVLMSKGSAQKNHCDDVVRFHQALAAKYHVRIEIEECNKFLFIHFESAKDAFHYFDEYHRNQDGSGANLTPEGSDRKFSPIHLEVSSRSILTIFSE